MLGDPGCSENEQLLSSEKGIGTDDTVVLYGGKPVLHSHRRWISNIASYNCLEAADAPGPVS